MTTSQPNGKEALPAWRNPGQGSDAAREWRQWFDPLGLQAAATEYLVDAWQRTVLYADIRRERGNQYLTYRSERAPNVLAFDFEPILSGMTLERPVNYWLVRILPSIEASGHAPTDPAKRPFIVVDPRAGHGPGIGGFKPDSEIGAALKAGHPCYFVGFLPEPVRGQTVEDVMRAEAAFVRCVGERHAESGGKPVVIGNCQAGWQILMTAAVWPELFGPIIIAGTPLSYWAGDKPMRHSGGLMGGSWVTALTSDLGGGRFDGAWLVQNFESLDPANTLWKKQYNVYSNVDTEKARYLEFEKYWGGLVFLEGDEMQYIVDNLFVGNKLVAGKLTTSDGIRIDLRNIRSPIIVFCSYGDNITPPAQALGWITDLYHDDDEVLAHDQTIVYATHDSIGHLGIFVSGSVGRKEHAEFAANIDVIDLLPAGVYRAVVDESPDAGSETAAPIDDDYLTTLRRSSLAEVREIVQPDGDNDRRFAAAAAVSEANLGLYRRFAQPWIELLAPIQVEPWGEGFQPLRMGFRAWSDQHPLAAAVSGLADQVRQNRRRVSPDNPFLQAQETMSAAIGDLLDLYRDQRDQARELAFNAIYGSPLVQAATSEGGDAAARRRPGDTPLYRAFREQQDERLRRRLNEGGLAEASIRGLFYVLQARGEADERHFRRLQAWLKTLPGLADADQPTLRVLVQEQGLLVRRSPAEAMAAVPGLIANAPAAQCRQASASLADLLQGGGALSEAEQQRLDEVQALLASGTRPDRASVDNRTEAAMAAAVQEDSH